LSDPAWAHSVATVRLAHRLAGRTLTNVFHVLDLTGAGTDADFLAIATALRDVWANGYGGVTAASHFQGSGVELVGARVHYVSVVGGPLRFLDVEGVLFTVPPGPGESLPAMATAVVEAWCLDAGRGGKGWQFFPWLGRDCVNAADPDVLTDAARDGIEDAYGSFLTAFAAMFDPLRFRLVVYHRDGRVKPGAVLPAWWDAIDAYHVRSARLSSLDVRLPMWKRRNTFTEGGRTIVL
jgi:hypothetical protein